VKKLDGISKPSFAYDLFKLMQDNNLHYIYRGPFTHKITDAILVLTETNIFTEEAPLIIRRKVYAVMVECLQNITRHQPDSDDIEAHKNGIFFLQNKGIKYFVTSGNLIKNENIESLKSKIDIINKLDSEELKKYYKKTLISGELSEKGGAGLGLIDMARKSGNKFLYNFVKIDDEYSYFYLVSETPSANEVPEVTEIELNVSINQIKELHETCNKNEILIVFNSSFSQAGLISLISIIDKKVQHAFGVKKLMYYLVVELIQNIIKHGDIYDDCGKTGIFFVSEANNNFTLYCGNFIQHTKTEKLKNRLESINHLTYDELQETYNKNLMDFETVASSPGLGLIDIRLKSQQPIDYCFTDVDEYLSFFSIKVTIPKN